jgi:hypothetical protein
VAGFLLFDESDQEGYFFFLSSASSVLAAFLGFLPIFMTRTLGKP